MNENAPFDAIVVGGGLCGLASAWWRTRRGESVLLLEANDTVGGVVQTEIRHGFTLEWGASSLPSTAQHVAALVADLPAAPRLVAADAAADKQYLMTASGLQVVPRSPPALLRSDLLPVSARLRFLAELAQPARRAASPGGRLETLHAFVTRRFGPHVAETFLRPFTNGIYGAAPERLGAADAFPQLAALEARYGGVIRGLMRRARSGKRSVQLIEGGMQRLPEAIATALGGRVRCGARVDHVEAGDSASPAAVTLASGERLEAREIELAVPAPAQAALLQRTAPEIADALASVEYVPMLVLALGWTQAAGPALPPSFGFLATRAGRLRILGATFRSCLDASLAPPNTSFVNVYLGGSEDPRALDLDDEQVVGTACRDLGYALGRRPEPTFSAVRRWPQAIPLFAPGHRGRMAALQARLDAARIRLSGSHITGVAIDRCVAPQAPLTAPLPRATRRI